MVASETDIANLALAHLGDDAEVSSFDPPEGSPQAEHCARFYPIARDVVLEAHGWSFATTTKTLTALDVEIDGWDYVYSLPADCLRPLRVYPPAGRRDPAQEYEFEVETLADGTAVLLTDVEDAALIFTRPIADTSKFSPAFVNALSWALASMLAGPVLKGDTGQKVGRDCWQVFAGLISQAQVLDARRSRQKHDHTPAWIGAR